MAQPKDWLGALVEQEIRAVIAWKQAIEQTPEVKADKDGRFTDDGSNFRSVVLPANLPNESKIQITSVTSTDDPVTLFITDGFTRVKAKLSEAALAKLESEIEGKITLDLRGDVVVIREAIVESTPYGPSEGFIQLVINDLEYLFHVRKALGQPVAIERKAAVQVLIGEITRLRCPPEEETRQFTPHPAVHTASAPRTGNAEETPKSQRSIRLSQTNSPSFVQSPTTQRALATQIPTQRKPAGPSLLEDGFEVEDGVNLSRPIERRNNERIVKANNPTVVASDSGLKLLSLLGKRKAEPAVEAAAVQPNEVLQSQLPPVIDTEPGAVDDDRTRRFVADPNAAAAVRKQSPAQQKQPSPRSRRDYRVREIPRDQQKLLDRPSSWFPPLPGQQFPHPNVPIDFLNRWKTQASAFATTDVQSVPADVELDDAASEEEPPEADGNDMRASESSSEYDSSEDEELPWSQTPEKQIPRLPPDSSMVHNSRPSTADKPLQIPPPPTNEAETPRKPPFDSSFSPASPRSRPASGGRSSINQSRPAHSPNYNTPAIGRSPIQLPQRSDLTPRTHLAHSPPQRLSSSKVTNLDGPTSRLSTSEGRSAHVALVDPSANSVEASPLASKSSPRPVTTPSVTLVKATQPSANENDTDDAMEVGVPRSLGQDPAIAHRKRRSEHFQAAQRRTWITNALIPDPDHPSAFFAIYNAYKKAHDKDAIKLAEFAEAINEIYPTEDGEPMKLRLRSSDARQHVQSNPALPKGTPTTDTPAPVVAPASTGPSEQPVKETPLRSSQTRRSLPWANSLRSTPNASPSINGSSKVPASSAVVGSAPVTATQRPATGIITPAANRNGLTTQPRRPILPFTANVLKAPSATQNRAITTPAAIPEQRQTSKAPIDYMDIDETQSEKPRINIFAEFARAYEALEPGGAFAEKGDVGKRNERKKVPKLDVLSWEL